VVQWLIGRQHFFHRFASVTVCIGLAMIPFMNIFSAGAYQRVGLERGVGFANPNDLGAWYGFCVLYLTIAGFTARGAGVRVCCWVLALVCFYLVTLTVSRAPLLAMAAATVIGSRRLLKQGFLLLLALLGLVYGAVELGVFDTAMQSYGLRAVEETGRLRVWPLLIDRFVESPLTGVGASHVGTWVRGDYITPHNGLLLIAVASGVLPIALFIGHWIKAAKAAFYAKDDNFPDSIFHLPMLTYAFLIMLTGNMSFMVPWAIVCMALPLSPYPFQTKV
jgi:O-antigen ligase